MDINIINIKEDIAQIAAVMSLWKKNKDKLGLFPEGAFSQHAERNEILVAKLETTFIGYLLYRTTKSPYRVCVTHLCISDNSWGLGVADALISALKMICQRDQFYGISLNCRRDYSSASRVWERNGFLPIKEKQGRGLKQSKITCWWWKNIQAQDLFESLENEDTDTLSVALDMNLIISMRDEKDDLASSLLDDWLIDDIEFWITPEIYNEINRNESDVTRAKTRAFINRFSQVSISEEKLKVTKKKLQAILPSITTQDKSDIKHLGYCCAVKLDYFLTRDERLLKHSEHVAEIFGTKLLRPEELVFDIDKKLNEDRYKPVRLGGTRISASKASATDLNNLQNIFLQDSRGEKRAEFRALIREVSSKVDTEIKIISDETGALTGLLAYSPIENGVEINFIRLVSNSVSNTLAMQLLEYICILASTEKKTYIKIVDKFSSVSETTLSKFGFFRFAAQAIKFVGRGVVPIERLTQQAATVMQNNFKVDIKEPEIIDAFSNLSPYEMERACWPVKLTGMELPIYVISIKSWWARDLFDRHIAEADLFGAEPVLAFNMENVYYSAAKLKMKAPARILWYVSKDNRTQFSGAIRAVSYLDEIREDTPKNLFREFKRLGVYTWEDVFNKAGRNLSKIIKALKFSRTEILKNPVTRTEIKSVFFKHGMKENNFQSPTLVPRAIFEELYETHA